MFPAHHAYVDASEKAGKLLLNGELMAKPMVVGASVTVRRRCTRCVQKIRVVPEQLVKFEVIEFSPSRYHERLVSLIAPGDGYV